MRLLYSLCSTGFIRAKLNWLWSLWHTHYVQPSYTVVQYCETDSMLSPELYSNKFPLTATGFSLELKLMFIVALHTVVSSRSSVILELNTNSQSSP